MTKKPDIVFTEHGRKVGSKSASARRGVVTFGSVSVVAPPANPALVSKNVLAGQSALERAVKKLTQPGVTIRSTKGVPLYSVDENRPTVIVRLLDGAKQRGVLKDGKFELVGE
ncbi:MAG: hypothetical protein ABSG68_25995 [Thermoguttaceae bacterium]|jgi:hypothetical protein